MTDTTFLQLPLLAAAQAQKHVTHNEALLALDALVHLDILDRDLTVPPQNPDMGDRYLIAAGAIGAWTGQDGKLAVYLDGIWRFFVPRAGWMARVADENVVLVYSGSAWTAIEGSLPSELQNLSLLGVGTAADPTNPFAAKLGSAVWTARTLAEGGDGGLRFKLNKETASDDLSMLFQTGFSGRAEIGLVGDDDLVVKVSPDGVVWKEGLRVNRTTGAVTFANTSFGSGSISDGDKGDITVSGGGQSWIIDAGAVTYTKMQTIPSGRILGRATAGVGTVEEIAIGFGLSLSGGTLSAISGGIGDGDKGDITVSGGGTSWTIDDGAVTSGKIADGAVANGKLATIAAGTIKGRASAGVGVVQDLTGAQLRDSILPAGAVIDRAYGEYTAYAGIIATTPVDDTIPQITEGTQIISVSLTPKSATNRVRIRAHVVGAHDVAYGLIFIQVHVSNQTDALAAALVQQQNVANLHQSASIEREYVPGTTSALTFSLRIGVQSGTFRTNGNNAGRFLGGSSRCTLVVEEIKA